MSTDPSLRHVDPPRPSILGLFQLSNFFTAVTTTGAEVSAIPRLRVHMVIFTVRDDDPRAFISRRRLRPASFLFTYPIISLSIDTLRHPHDPALLSLCLLIILLLQSRILIRIMNAYSADVLRETRMTPSFSEFPQSASLFSPFF